MSQPNLVTVPTPHGAVVLCQRCQVSAPIDGVTDRQFAAAHQNCGHYGLGDMVAQATKAVGIKPCSPCQERQRRLNQLAPRLWPRR